MTLFNKITFFIIIAISINVTAKNGNKKSPGIEEIIQQGFPTQIDELKKIISDLLNEYQNEHNVTSLIFYSYGVLKLANYYKLANNYVAASEYAKLGFFYLDESVDSHEDNWRLHYLRARVDAYLPKELGRCVIALKDTKILLQHNNIADEILAKIKYMRYRALLSCQNFSEAEQLKLSIEKGAGFEKELLSNQQFGSENWRKIDVNEIIIPLMKGE